jgi:hypothetical protein
MVPYRSGQKCEAWHEVATTPLDEPEARIEVHMAWRKGENSGAVFAFLGSVRKVFKKK